MVVKVFSRFGHRPERSLLSVSLAGDTVPVRLRSVSIGLVGLVAAVGLGLVAMFVQQEFPGEVNAPLPGLPLAGVVHNDTLGLAGSSAHTGNGDASGVPAQVASSRSEAGSPAAEDSGPARPPRSEGPAGGAAPGIRSPASQPGEAPAPAPAPVPAPGPARVPTAAEPPATSAPPPAPSQPVPVEAPAPVVPPAPEEQIPVRSPGRSAEAPGHTPGTGPPPWAANGDGAVAKEVGHGKPSWAGH